jgi:hypothetical protein
LCDIYSTMRLEKGSLFGFFLCAAAWGDHLLVRAG